MITVFENQTSDAIKEVIMSKGASDTLYIKGASGFLAAGQGSTSGAKDNELPSIDIPKGLAATLVIRNTSSNGTVDASLTAFEEW